MARYLRELPLRAREAIMGALGAYGRQRAAPGLESRPIRPPLYEFKLKQYRLLYAEFAGVVVILHVFEKQSQKTPVKAIETAAQRLKIEQARRRIH